MKKDYLVEYGVYIAIFWSIVTLSGFAFENISYRIIQASYYALLLLGGLSLINLFRRFAGLHRDLYFFVMVLCFFVPLLNTILQLIFFEDYFDSSVDKTVLTFALSVMIVMITSFFVGAFLASVNIHTRNKLSLVVVILLFYGISLLVTDGFLIDWISINKAKDLDVYASHLTLELPLIVLILLLLAQSTGFVKDLIFIISVLVLWSFGGRTLLLVFVLSYIYFANVRFSIKLLSVLLFLILAFIFLSWASGFDEDIFISRMLLLDGLGSDKSAQARTENFIFAIQNMTSYFLIGHMSLHALHFGEFGAYAHNVYSAIQFFGFIYFLVLVYAVYLSFKSLYRIKSMGVQDGKLFFGFMLLSISVMSLVVGKYVGSPIFWMALGYVYMLSNCAGNKIERV